MLPIGHMAYTWAALTYLQSKDLARNIDFRGAAVAAMLPDLIDKPLSLTLLRDSGTSQGPMHTFFVQTLSTAFIARFKPEWLPYALIANSHLLADQMWKYPRTLFFPFSGKLDSWKFMGSPTAMINAYAEIITRPSIMAIEIVGLALLAWVARRGKLWRCQEFKHFWATGKLDAADQEFGIG